MSNNPTRLTLKVYLVGPEGSQPGYLILSGSLPKGPVFPTSDPQSWKGYFLKTLPFSVTSLSF